MPKTLTALELAIDAADRAPRPIIADQREARQYGATGSEAHDEVNSSFKKKPRVGAGKASEPHASRSRS